MSVALVAAGSAIFLLLGVGHAVFTFQSKPDGGPMMPTDPETLAAMSRSGGLGLAPHLDTTLFRAWVGFNLSHSLGVIAIALILMANAFDDLGAAVGKVWFLVLAFGAPALYFFLAINFWFDKPRDGIALGAALVWIGLIVELL